MTSIIFAKHAQHVVLIHFPIALFLTRLFCGSPAVSACGQPDKRGACHRGACVQVLEG